MLLGQDLAVDLLVVGGECIVTFLEKFLKVKERWLWKFLITWTVVKDTTLNCIMARRISPVGIMSLHAYAINMLISWAVQCHTEAWHFLQLLAAAFPSRIVAAVIFVAVIFYGFYGWNWSITKFYWCLLLSHLAMMLSSKMQYQFWLTFPAWLTNHWWLGYPKKWWKDLKKPLLRTWSAPSQSS